jgi:hypothetical protein
MCGGCTTATPLFHVDCFWRPIRIAAAAPVCPRSGEWTVRCQFTGPLQSRRRDRVAPVCLDALARTFREKAGATTLQSWPSASTWRQSPYPSARLQSRPAAGRTDPPVSQSCVRSATDCFRHRQEIGLPPLRPPSAIATACFSWRHQKPQKLRYAFPWSALRA